MISIDTLSRMVKSRLGEDPVEALSEVADRLVKSTIAVTTTVYLRPHCRNCVYRDFTSNPLEQLAPLPDPVKDLNQFLRQLVILTKEYTEAYMKERSCEMGDINEVVRKVTEQLKTEGEQP